MKKFESPEINVVKFINDDVITTSGDGGYENTGEVILGSKSFALQPASDQGIDVPF
ncbi:hypothetical protein [uncultured Eubacterium sp.]|uniref:hypothetical protein n=1 Tax=uncultured Eubacterium sp. TaxID=165185 RepID=UPI0026190643|nr:hypothetical protein [uncultured Eubacterium sp.]